MDSTATLQSPDEVLLEENEILQYVKVWKLYLINHIWWHDHLA